MTNRFVQIHTLTNYAASNLNRDDNGSPKSIIYGGVERTRVSSQCLKRNFRVSDIFERAIGDSMGTRTKLIAVEAHGKLVELGMKEALANKVADSIGGIFGKVEKAGKGAPHAKGKLSAVAFVSHQEQEAIDALVKLLVEENREPTTDELKILRTDVTSADVACFGRMIAASPEYNILAAVQVAHALTVHSSSVEDDFFTAMDDLESQSQSTHIGESQLATGLFYNYVCIDRETLIENLDGNEELANACIQAMIHAACTVSPKGKQGSFASRSRASWAMVECGEEQPYQLSGAFLSPIDTTNQLEDSIAAIEAEANKFTAMYGARADRTYVLGADMPLNKLLAAVVAKG